MKIAELLEATVAETAATMRRHAQAVASVIEGQIAEINQAQADLVEISEKAQAERATRLEAFLALHRSYHDAENASETLIVDGRLAALESQRKALRNLAEKVLAGEAVMPNVAQSSEPVINMDALTNPPILKGHVAADNDSVLDANQEAAAAEKEKDNGNGEEKI